MKGKLRSELLDERQKLLPPTIMVPAKRLEYLVEQTLNLQREACMFHNSADWEMSFILTMTADNIPSRTLQVSVFFPYLYKASCNCAPLAFPPLSL